MPFRVNFNIPDSEVAEMRRAMKKLRKRTAKEVKQGIAKATFEADSVASKNAPVDKGILRNSIRPEIENNGFTGNVSTNVEYARIQERRKRYMEKGFRAAVRKIERMLKV